MFDKNDFENMKKFNNNIPDGVMDASSFYEDLVFLSNLLEKTNFDSPDERMESMMNVINYFYIKGDDEELYLDQDRVYGITIALLFHLCNIFSGIDDEDRVDYWNTVNNEMLPDMSKDKTIIPYWDTDE